MTSRVVHRGALLILMGQYTHLLNGELFISLDLDLTGFLSSFLRDESDLCVRLTVPLSWSEKGITILFISDWISASLSAPVRDILRSCSRCD